MSSKQEQLSDTDDDELYQQKGMIITRVSKKLFMSPERILPKYPISRFENIDDKSHPDLLLQKRKKQNEKKKLFRIITRHKFNGLQYIIAKDNNLTRQWHYICTKLSESIPEPLKGSAKEKERLVWLMAHFTRLSLEEDSEDITNPWKTMRNSLLSSRKKLVITKVKNAGLDLQKKTSAKIVPTTDTKTKIEKEKRKINEKPIDKKAEERRERRRKRKQRRKEREKRRIERRNQALKNQNLKQQEPQVRRDGYVPIPSSVTNSNSTQEQSVPISNFAQEPEPPIPSVKIAPPPNVVSYIPERDAPIDPFWTQALEPLTTEELAEVVIDGDWAKEDEEWERMEMGFDSGSASGFQPTEFSSWNQAVDNKNLNQDGIIFDDYIEEEEDEEEEYKRRDIVQAEVSQFIETEEFSSLCLAIFRKLDFDGDNKLDAEQARFGFLQVFWAFQSDACPREGVEETVTAFMLRFRTEKQGVYTFQEYKSALKALFLQLGTLMFLEHPETMTEKEKDTFPTFPPPPPPIQNQNLNQDIHYIGGPIPYPPRKRQSLMDVIYSQHSSNNPSVSNRVLSMIQNPSFFRLCVEIFDALKPINGRVGINDARDAYYRVCIGFYPLPSQDSVINSYIDEVLSLLILSTPGVMEYREFYEAFKGIFYSLGCSFLGIEEGINEYGTTQSLSPLKDKLE